MKLLWLSNFRFSDEPSAISGTWIESMGVGILKYVRDIELVNITTGPNKDVLSYNARGILQYVLPYRWLDKSGNPNDNLKNTIEAIVKSLKPDIVHVWGTERFWGDLTRNNAYGVPTLLEMQGIPYAMVPYMTGCLTQKQLKECFGVKELLRPRLSVPSIQAEYERSGTRERRIIKGHKYIDYQSEWVKSHLDSLSLESVSLFKTRMSIREEFLCCAPWTYQAGNRRILCYTGFNPNKGAHTLLWAVALLKKRFPDIRAVLPGLIQNGIRRSGYIRWLFAEVARLGLNDCVEFPGMLNADELINEMKKAAVVVNPSYVESYSISLAEAMAVGCPCVASYAGAMPEVAEDGKSALFFPIADFGACANQIANIFCDEEKSIKLAENAMARSRTMHNANLAVVRQMEIYNMIIGR